VTTVRVTIEEIGGGKTRMTIVTEFPTVEAMEQLAMGVEEGRTQSVGQIDAILADFLQPQQVPACAHDRQAARLFGEKSLEVVPPLAACVDAIVPEVSEE
jgi:hypothetical protein